MPRPEDGRPFWERMTLRERESLNPLGKPLPPKVAHRAHPEITVVQGNHRVEGADVGGELDDGSIEILHFPMRTYAQFENKIVKGGRAYARNRELPATHRPHLAAPVRGSGSRAAFAITTTEQVVAEADREDLLEDTRLRDYLRALDRAAARLRRGRRRHGTAASTGTSPRARPSPATLGHSERSISGQSSASRAESSR